MPFRDNELSGFELNNDVTDTGIAVFDQNGHFLYVNNSFLTIRNVDRSFYSSITAFDLSKNGLIDKCIMDEVCKKHIPVSDVQLVKSEDGKVIKKHLVTVYPIFDENHSIKNFIAYYKNLDTFIHSEEGTTEEAPPFVIGDTPIVAESPVTKTLYTKAKRAADTDATILITGETGTGKDVFARFIHANSRRRNKELVIIDCTSLPSSLMEAELFGYEKGSFTGANQSKPGLIESADGGTLFIDEINSLPLDLQGKLLRTLETKTIKRIGSVKSKPVDFRLLVATNINLLQCVKDKKFRLDLYYRINILTFDIPPLRARKEDIVPLARVFEHVFRQKYGREIFFSTQLYNEMLAYSWPGNVRELRNFVEKLVIMGPDDISLPVALQDPVSDSFPAGNGLYPPEHSVSEIPVGFPEDIQKPSAPKADAGQPRDLTPHFSSSRNTDPETEKARIIEALRINGNHREKTAQYLNISRRTLQYKLKKYGLI